MKRADLDRLSDESVDRIGETMQREIARLVDQHGVSKLLARAVLLEVIEWAVTAHFE